MIIAIGSLDRNFDADEKRIAAKIAKELALNPAEFDLG
jgi:tellurite resistance protein TerB